MSIKNENLTNLNSNNIPTIAAEQNAEGKDSESSEETEKYEENFKPNYTTPISGTARVQFNKIRKIIIRNVPPVTYEEVKTYMNGYSVDNISISKKSRHAIVTLVDGEKAEEICESLKGKKLLGTDVTVSVYPNENLLCVAHLPFNLEDKDFFDIVSEFGGVERCFLLRSDSGKSKGYGFVEWQHNKEKSSQARQMIDNKKLGSCTLHCEFLEPTILSFEDLHSKCIRVDHLPPNYSNASELMNILSRVQSPKFFRLGARSEGQGFAIVGYEDAVDAEKTQQQVNGYMLNGHMIRVTYCIPGQEPEDIYNGLKVNAIPGNKGCGLLPPPSSLMDMKPNMMNAPGNDASTDQKGLMNGPDITNPAMQNLLAQSPQVLQTFQNILLQLQQQNINRMHHSKPGLLGMAPDMPHNNVLLNPNMQVALLAVILASQIQQAQPSILSNPILQQMITTSMQQQSNVSRPSLLGNPMIAQANMMLQTSNLMKLLSSTSPNSQNINVNVIANFNQLVNTLQGMEYAFAEQQNESENRETASAAQGPNSNNSNGKKSSLGQTPFGPSSTGLLGNAPQGSQGKGPMGGTMGPANPLLALFLEQQIRQQIAFQQAQNQISELVSNSLKRRHVSVNNNSNPQAYDNNSSGLMPTPGSQGYPLLPNPNGAAGAVRSLFGGNSNRVGLLPTPFVDDDDDDEEDYTGPIPHLMQSFVSGGSTITGSTRQDDLNSPAKKFPKMEGQVQKGLLGDMPDSIKQRIMGYSTGETSSDSGNKENLGFDPSTGFWAQQSDYGYGSDSTAEQWQSDYNEYYSKYYSAQQNGAQSNNSSQYNTKQNQQTSNFNSQQSWYQQASEYSLYYQQYFQQYGMGQQCDYFGQNYGNNDGSNMHGNWSDYYVYSDQQQYVQPPIPEEPSDLFSSEDDTNSSSTNRPKPLIKMYNKDYLSKKNPSMKQRHSSTSNIQPLPPGTEPPSLLGPPPSATPIGGHKKPHLLPSPEPSPDGHYIGQHSQGLGGHYADSYVKKGKLNF